METKRKFLDCDNVLENKRMKRDTTLEPDIIVYISVPSLESMAIINIGAALCKQSDIRDSMRKHSLKFDPEEGSERGTSHDCSLSQIKENLLNNSSLLPLPNSLKAKVSNCIEHIVLQILKWMCNDRKDVEYIDSICWTNEGNIDETKTLKQLIDKDTGQHIHNIYKLACTYCLEESIHNLWDKLPGKIKEDCLYCKIIYKEYNNHLIAYWTHAVNNKLPKLLSKIRMYDFNKIYNHRNSLHNNMFKLAILEGNSSAVKYFWNKLSIIDISNNLKQWIKDVVSSQNRDSNILCFLLSKINDKDQQEVLQKNSDVILNSLFEDWPLQRFLLPAINRMWNFLDKKVYVTLLNNITLQIKEGKTTEKLFRSLWCDSPANFKKCYIQIYGREILSQSYKYNMQSTDSKRC